MRNAYSIVVILLATSVLPLLFATNAPPQSDVSIYHQLAASLMAGEMPYRDQPLGYPPYAILVFLLPWFALGKHQLDVGEYQFAFAVLVLVADSTLKCFLLAEGLKHRDRLIGLLPLVLYCLSVPFIRFFYLQRYDIFPSLITVVALCCFTRGCFGWAGGLLMVGAAMKVYPTLLLPVLWTLAVRHQGVRSHACLGHSPLRLKCRSRMRFAAGGAVGLLPLTFLSFFLPWWEFLAGHMQRGLQVETLYASMVWLTHLAGIADATWSAPVGGFIEVSGSLALSLIPWAKCLLVTATFASITFSVWVGYRCSALTLYQLSRLAMVPLLPFVAFNLVISPQYMIWLLPLAALGTLGGRAWPMMMIATATAVTPIFYPSPEYMTGLNMGQTIMLLFRNLSLVVVWVVLLSQFWCLARRANTR